MDSNYLGDIKSDNLMKKGLHQFNDLKKEGDCSSPTFNKTKNSTNKQVNKRNNDSKKSELYSRITVEDLQKLCDQLSAFNARVKTAQEIIHLRYDLPNYLQDKLDAEAGELECLHRELKDATNNIQIIRNQRAALDKEKTSIEEQTNRIKLDMVNELEVIVSVYDSNMMDKWEAVKAGSSITAVDNFLHDVKGKLQAMKNLQILGSQKLTELKNEDKKKMEKIIKKEKKKNKDERSQTRNARSSSNFSNASQTTLPFLIDTDSDDVFDDNTTHSVLYSLICDQVLSLPAWTQGVMDID